MSEPIAPSPPPITDATPARLRPFLEQWDYIAGVLFERLDGLTDEELLWEPAPTVWTVRLVDGRPVPDVEVWPPSGESAPPRTLVWTLGHLGGMRVRADWLVGEHRLQGEDLEWPMTARAALEFARDGIAAWRNGLATMTDEDLDTVGRSAYPGGLDPELPLIDIVWWLNKELVFHSAEAWFMRDLFGARGRGAPATG
jgi:hypothetical protein